MECWGSLEAGDAHAWLSRDADARQSGQVKAEAVSSLSFICCTFASGNMQVRLQPSGGAGAVGWPCSLAHLFSRSPSQAASLKQFVGAPSKRHGAAPARRGRLVSPSREFAPPRIGGLRPPTSCTGTLKPRWPQPAYAGPRERGCPRPRLPPLTPAACLGPAGDPGRGQGHHLRQRLAQEDAGRHQQGGRRCGCHPGPPR